MTSYSKIALHLGQGSDNIGNLRACLKARDWLDSEESGACRMFVDQLDERRLDLFPQLLHDVLPVRKGTIIFTSRDRSLISSKLLLNRFVIDANRMQELDAQELI